MHSLFAAASGGSRKRARSNPPPQHLPVTRFANCRLLRDHELREEDLWTQGGVIVDPQRLFWEGRQADVTVDCKGLILAPGYIDLQLNGGWGADFSTPTDVGKAVETVAAGVVQHGVTAFLPTVITSSAEAYHRILPHLTPRAGRAKTTASGGAAAVLGVHLEGPFISSRKSGCHPVEHIQPAEGGAKQLRATYGDHLAHVRLVTLAPELPGADALIDELVARKVVVAAGHSAASVEQMEVALRRGVTMCTHLFNAMPPFSHELPGVIGVLGLTQHKPFFGLIADGVHVHPSSLKIASEARRERAVLVTDAMSATPQAMGLAPGAYTLGDLSVVVAEEEEGDAHDGAPAGSAQRLRRVTLAGGATLAGALAPMDECVRRYREYCGLSAAQALEAASLHPAQVLGLQGSKGSLAVGADADLLLLDDGLHVQTTYVGGSLAWQRE